MKILLLRLPLVYGASSISRLLSPGGYLSSRLYCEWLVRYPPLGLLYYGSILKKNDHSVKLIDGELTGISFNKLLLLAKEYNPDIILATVNIYNPRAEFDFLSKLKDSLGCFIAARGHFPQLYPEESICNKGIDCALTGKGFNTIINLARAVEQHIPLEKIKGIIFKNNQDEIVKTGPEEPYAFNNLPHPARELIDNAVYTTALTKNDLFTTITTSIGCPYSCTYCVDRHIPYQTRSIDNIIAEIRDCIDNFGIKEVTFLDSTFTVDKTRTIQLCEAIIEQGLKFKWAIRTRPDRVDNELLSLLAKAGCVSIHYGIESGDQQILDNLKRNNTLKTIQQAIEMTSRNGLETLGFFMIGNTGETPQTINNTIRFARSLPLDIAQFNVAFPVPPSNIYINSLKTLGQDIWLESYKGKEITAAMCKPQDTALAAEELTYWAKKAYRSFYLRPGYFLRLAKYKYFPHILLRQFKLLLLHIKISFNRI
ncbi:MAG: radical SAM protein [Candidatus Omnitrophota bacterium]